ncbi:hypothetical protein BDV96DRAFT_491887 [Lophiotrema nucula]|uniref:Uncharacterized protein n=1 Tax=Lophiotrema nucula TaxID=690887 RepID=A0A6A5ZBB1_9PLEO|nr:hypothetical protein BDV96DRAFT_491887 [Lophiotrema nucula]
MPAPQASPTPVTNGVGAGSDAAASSPLTPVHADTTGVGSSVGPTPGSHSTTELSTQIPDQDADELAEGTADGGDAAAAGSTGNATAPAVREFICMNDEYSECQTGQYTLALSRKVISNHFGRNKGCTRLIQDWPLFCRKHYQRATYKPDLWQRRKVFLILRQLDKIEELHPGTTYDVVLKKAEEKRLNDFARKMAGGMDAADAAETVAPDTDIKSFQAPVEVLRQLEFYLGPDRSKGKVQEVVALILDMLKKGETKEVPSIEFLPFFPGTRKGDRKSKAKAKGHGARTSAKGGIKKTNQKA